MTSRAAIAILPRHRAPISDSKVIPFPRRGRRHAAHAGGGRGGGPYSHAAGPPPSDIDGVIRLAWHLHVRGEVSWDAASELHDALNSLREDFANPRERRRPE
jgi:hypothetical protein